MHSAINLNIDIPNQLSALIQINWIYQQTSIKEGGGGGWVNEYHGIA